MNRRGIKGLVVTHYVLVVLIATILLESMFCVATRQYYYNSIINLLSNHAKVSASLYNKFVGDISYFDLSSHLTELMQSFAFDSAELQIIGRDGVVMTGTSGFAHKEKLTTDDVKRALSGKTGSSVGTNAETGEKIMAVSSPLKFNGQTIAVMRYVTSLDEVDSVLRTIYTVAILAGAAVLLIVVLISTALANSIVRPIKYITNVSSQMADGNFDVRIRGDYRYEIGELARTLNYMAEEIVRSDTLKNDFISSISHEIRTPLTSIKGWSETIISGNMADVEETKQGMKIISKETDRLIGLVENLLDFARLQDNRIVLADDAVNMDELLQEVILQLRSKTDAKQIRIRYETRKGGAPVLVEGDENRLKQVFINILDNAVKFSSAGSNVEVDLKLADEAVMVRIEDSGIGIDRSHLNKVRRKFYQVDPHGGGAGLGLAVCQEIVELHRGAIDIVSTSDKGTVVTITLPHTAERSE